MSRVPVALLKCTHMYTPYSVKHLNSGIILTLHERQHFKLMYYFASKTEN